MAKLLFIFLFFSFSFGLTIQGRSVGKCHMSQCNVTQIKSYDNHRKVVHKLYGNCISNIQEIHKDSIEFSLSSADKRAVGFIPAEELAILILELNSITSRHRSS